MAVIFDGEVDESDLPSETARTPIRVTQVKSGAIMLSVEDILSPQRVGC